MFKIIISVLVVSIFGSLVEEINKDPTSTWVAVEYPPEIMSLEKMRSRIIRNWIPLPEGAVDSISVSVGASASFDARTKWGSLVLPVRDQAQCGSCWAFAAAETVGDRVGIAGGASQVYSPQDLVSCDKNNQAVHIFFFFFFFFF
jgi:cathepsin B